MSIEDILIYHADFQQARFGVMWVYAFASTIKKLVMQLRPCLTQASPTDFFTPAPVR
jgi:hypothetical protein